MTPVPRSVLFRVRPVGFLMVLAVLVAGCRTSAPGQAPVPKVAPVSSAAQADWERRAEAHAAFAAGLVRGMNGDSEGLLNYFERVTEKDLSNYELVADVARRFLQQGKTDRALKLLDRVAERPDAPGELHALHGVALTSVGRTAEALKAYMRAAERPPVIVAVYQAVVRILADDRRTAEALPLLIRARKSFATEPGSLLDIADLYRVIGSADARWQVQAKAAALEVLAQVRSLKPEDPALALRLSDRYAQLGQADQAESVLRELQERAPRNSAAVSRLAELYLRSGRIPEASRQLEALRKIDPANPVTYYFLGVVALEEKQFERARNHFERAILINPGLEPAHTDLAVALLSLLRPEEAVNVLDRARKEVPPSFRIEYLSGVARSQLKRFDQALEAYSAAEKLGSTNQPPLTDHRFYFQVGALLERKGDETKSIEYLEKALELKPDYDDALNHLGYMWAEKGKNLPKARAMIEQALKAEPENPAYMDSMGWVLFKLGKHSEALDWLLKARQRMTEPDATVLDHVGDAAAACARWDLAREAWAASLKVEASSAIAKKLADAPSAAVK
ncbi:MAG: tetratricopeptide repeat protein [Verrucomicrobiota bacterium]|nr:tetratricopeptide repeat protein [Verrucomicrobiota bacterium]